MVASCHCDPISISNFESNEQANCLNRVVSSINIVSQEQVIGVRDITSNRKQLYQIVKLTMNISTNGYGCSHRLYVGFSVEYLDNFAGEEFYLLLGYFVETLELFYYVVNIRLLHFKKLRNIIEMIRSIRWYCHKII